MSNYAPLRDFLANSKVEYIRLDFAELERILGFRLPESAYRYPAWWSNNPKGHSHCLAWVGQGWEASKSISKGGRLRFDAKM